MTLPEVQVGCGNLFFFWTNRLTSGVLNQWFALKKQRFHVSFGRMSQTTPAEMSVGIPGSRCMNQLVVSLAKQNVVRERGPCIYPGGQDILDNASGSSCGCLYQPDDEKIPRCSLWLLSYFHPFGYQTKACCWRRYLPWFSIEESMHEYQCI